MTTLKDIKAGEKAKVVRINGEGQIRKRIMDLGITKGCEIEVIKVAPLGDPVEISLRGYDLSIRKVDAEFIEVE
jgi:ferrous iron transport protein A